MPSRKTRLIAAAFVAALTLALDASAQKADDAGGWIVFSPDGESFSVQLPAKPSANAQAALPNVASPAGKLYEARRDGVEYRVWSLERARPAGNDAQSISDYLDSCAEMAWTIVVRPEAEQAARAGTITNGVRYGMDYVRDSQVGDTNTIYSTREYGVTLAARRGLAYIFTDGERAYVALAQGPPDRLDNVRAFLDSFAVRAPDGRQIRMRDAPPARGASTPNPANLPYGDPKSKSAQMSSGPGGIGTGAGGGVGSGEGGGVGPGRGGNTGGGDRPAGGGGPGGPVLSCEEMKAHIFSVRDVTRRAQVFRKPEPTYTEWARVFSVTGTVRLRGVLSADGTVSNIAVLTRLPHGLTLQAVQAMHAVAFEPAQKDGCKVSQYVAIEYNFNIY